MHIDLEPTFQHLFLSDRLSCNISVLLAGTEHIGTSWLSLSLAHALNLSKQRVLLIDGNGNLANIATYILLQNPLFLDDYFSEQKTINQLITAYKNMDFNILSAYSGNNYLEKQPLGRIHVFINDLKTIMENYHQTLIDIGSDINEKNLAFCHIAHNLIFVLSDKNSDLVKTFEIIKFMHHNKVKAKYHLIINKVNSFEDGYKVFKEMSKAMEKNNLSIPNLLGIVRTDTRVRDTIRNKELLLTRYPTSEAAIDIQNITNKIMLEQNNG